jgi:D-mannose binding lectin/S-locus glycoprotein domain/PAN-like domain
MLRKITSKQYITIILIALIQICSSLDTLVETKNITGGQTLVSSGRIFELGFFKPGMSTNWFVGIWYLVSPEIVVWIANRDHPLNQSSSTLGISKGAIVLSDPSQNIVWSSSVNSSIANISNCIMQLLDSGNLVIKYTDKRQIIWQSFDYPSNTLLPGMKLGKNLATGFEWFLSSWKSEMDPSKGKYYYKMDTLGVPQNILWNSAQIEFRTGPWDGLRFSGVPEMKTYENMFSFKLVSDVNEVYYTFETKQGGPLSRLVLNETGVVQRMVWDKTSRTWSEFWYGPKDPCDYYGKCGPFGVCNINDVTICSGLQGFSPKSPKQWSMRNFSGGYYRETQLSCHDHDNGFYLVKGVKVPDTRSSTVYDGISIEECRNRCLMNCSCLAYSVLDIRESGSGCIMWSTDLIDIRYIPGTEDLYVKTAKTDLGNTLIPFNFIRIYLQYNLSLFILDQYNV